jgi:aspartyl-tRNA(Asn)/glutamyl-tRNA(Gln) amidotransferase subunit C
METINKETFDHLVSLAALQLNEQEGEYLRAQLNHQIAAIDELTTIPLDASVPPAKHGVPYPQSVRPPLRSDEWKPFPHPEEILTQAPETEDNYFVVPDIPHTKLD